MICCFNALCDVVPVQTYRVLCAYVHIVTVGAKRTTTNLYVIIYNYALDLTNN